MTSHARQLFGLAGSATVLLKASARAFGLAPRASLRVLVYHDVPAHLRANSAAQLRELALSWRFVGPAEFEGMMTGEVPVRGRNLMVTFDDGFASNRAIAEEVLRPMGIKALFFVVPGFVDIAGRDESRRYIVERMQPGEDLGTLDPGLANMGWADLEALLDMGHSVGGHTCTHARLATLTNASELQHEIASCGDTIAARLGCHVNHFAFPYGEITSVTAEAIAIAARRYRFVHSGLRGENRHTSPLAVRRDVVSPTESMGVVHAFVEGLADPRYARPRAVLDEWAAHADEAAR